MKTREAAVAGLFYPGGESALRAQVEGFLAGASGGEQPKALIGPHAGTKYSGAVAASAYAHLEPTSGSASIERVVLLGPSHRVAFRGIATSTAAQFRTPLGTIPIDRSAVDELEARFEAIFPLDEAHRQEHSLELHLPFLQTTLGPFQIVPLVIGPTPTQIVAEVLDALWGGEETLIVISSDLSHFHDYDTAQQMDRQTSDSIETLAWEKLEHDGACGFYPVRGLLETARRRGMSAQTVDLRNSGDTAGARNEVVGYGSYLFH